MPAELDQTTPEMGQDPAMDAPDMGAEPMGLDSGETDREGAMAKQELIKLAHYAQSLQEHIQDEDQLESWCQAKITMAAQNIASVYHYMAYEKKIGEYGDALENNPALNESQRTYLRNRLAEAKMKIKELKKAQAVLKEDFDLKKSGDTANTHKGGTVTKTDKGLTHSKGDYDDEPFAEPSKKPSKAAKSSSEKSGDRAHDKAQNKEYKALKAQGKAQRYSAGQPIDEEKTEPCDHCGGAGHVPKAPVQVHPAHAKKVDDYSKFRKAVVAIAGDKNGDGVVDEKDKAMAESKSKCCCENSKKTMCPVHGKIDEAKPSAGLSKAKKSATVKDAKAGKDIGKPGKGFDKLAKKAGGGEKGEKIAAAAMWKNIKETQAYVAEKKEVEKKAKTDYDGDGKVESGKDEHAGAVDKAIKASKAKETVKESSDISRLRELTGRLNQNERQTLNESGEVASIRALTQRLLG